MGQFLGQNGAVGVPRADLGTETVEGQGSHLPPLHRCLPLLNAEGVISLASAGQVAGHMAGHNFITPFKHPLLRSTGAVKCRRGCPQE